jgi:exosome complex RNA-binding protein Rrp4
VSAGQYLPVAEDLVIGIVAEKHSENYKLDIGGPEVAQPLRSSKRSEPLPTGSQCNQCLT